MSMWLLIHFKLQIGKELDSQAIIADARCTKTCIYLSFILLLAGIGYEIQGSVAWILLRLLLSPGFPSGRAGIPLQGCRAKPAPAVAPADNNARKCSV